MANIVIRNLEPVVVEKFNELAKKKKMSREEYLRRYLTKISEMEEVLRLDEKYANLVAVLSERLEQANDVIEINTLMLEKIENRMKGM